MLAELLHLLEKREFISVATCDLKGRPNAAPKFVLKADEGHLYLVDYTIGMTYQNLKVNPRVSVSFIDPRSLKGYQLNGTAVIIEKGRLYEKMRREMVEKEIRLTAEHLIQDVRGEARHDVFEVGIGEKYVVFKVAVDEVVEIGPRGEITRKRKGPL